MKDRFISWLLRWLSYKPGTVIVQGRRSYVIDINGARRRLGRES